MHGALLAVFALSAAVCTSAANIYIQVGANTTNNASQVFQPQEVHAVLGDTVFFNFTAGNHSATESTFAAPCIPAHESDPTINGFDSLPRPIVNGTGVGSILAVPILPENVNHTFWFYDINTCGEGGVGVINANDSSTQTLQGYERNAIRLDGPSSTATSASATSTRPASSTQTTSTSATGTATASSSAERKLILGALSALPLVAAALAL